MNKPLVSVITPVYDVESYILDYLKSIQNQTYRNLEIICIEDGSPDRCGEILDDYASHDSRILVIHQNNQGYNHAVNRGLDSVSGQYVCFVDPDDWVEADFCKEAVACAQATRADIVTTNYFKDYSHGSEAMRNLRPIPDVFNDKTDAFHYLFEADVYSGFKAYLWNKLFDSKFFFAKERTGLGLRMAQDFVIGTDSLLSAQCFLNADKFAYIPTPFVHHRIRDRSLMRSHDFSRRLGFETAMDRIVDMLASITFDEEVINIIKRYHTFYCGQLAEFAYAISDKEGLEYSKALMSKYMTNYVRLNAPYAERIDWVNAILKKTL